MSTIEKTAMRTQMKALRAELSARDPDAGETVADKFPLKLLERYGPTVAAYLPIGSELDTRPLIEKLAKTGAQIALPRIEDDGQMTYRQWNNGDALEDRPFGLKEPPTSAPVLAPTLVLAPLLAYDRNGNRLGYGKGHYDRALSELRKNDRAFVCGIAFHGQEVDEVPAEAHDIPLDWVVTEHGSIPVFMMRTFTKSREST